MGWIKPAIYLFWSHKAVISDFRPCKWWETETKNPFLLGLKDPFSGGQMIGFRACFFSTYRGPIASIFVTIVMAQLWSHEVRAGRTTFFWDPSFAWNMSLWENAHSCCSVKLIRITIRTPQEKNMFWRPNPLRLLTSLHFSKIELGRARKIDGKRW